MMSHMLLCYVALSTQEMGEGTGAVNLTWLAQVIAMKNNEARRRSSPEPVDITAATAATSAATTASTTATTTTSRIKRTRKPPATTATAAAAAASKKAKTAASTAATTVHHAADVDPDADLDAGVDVQSIASSTPVSTSSLGHRHRPVVIDSESETEQVLQERDTQMDDGATHIILTDLDNFVGPWIRKANIYSEHATKFFQVSCITQLHSHIISR